MKNAFLFLGGLTILLFASFNYVSPKAFVNGKPAAFLLNTPIKSGDAITLTDTVQVDFALVNPITSTNGAVLVLLHTDANNTDEIRFGNKQINASNYAWPANSNTVQTAKTSAPNNLRAKATATSQVFSVAF